MMVRPTVLPDRKLTSKERDARYRAAHPERRKANAKRWNVANKDHKREYNQRWNAANKDRKRVGALLYRYGLTTLDYATLVAQQKGVCAICGRPPRTVRGLEVDHDHVTGQVRGLLCHGCNLHLGWYEKRFDAMHTYLKGIERGDSA